MKDLPVSNLIALNTYGASTMTGYKNGLVTLFNLLRTAHMRELLDPLVWQNFQSDFPLICRSTLRMTFYLP